MSRHAKYQFKALREIAIFAARSPLPSDATFDDLCSSYSRSFEDADTKASRKSLENEEIEALLALSNAAPWINSHEKASGLVSHLSHYLVNIQKLTFPRSSFLKDLHPSPWEALTFQLTNALLILGLKFSELHGAVYKTIRFYLQNLHDHLATLQTAGNPNESSHEHRHSKACAVVSIAVSLIGFLEAVASRANLFESEELAGILTSNRDIVDKAHSSQLPTAFSAVQAVGKTGAEFDDWGLYSRQYTAEQRPLGMMLLFRSFLKLLVSTSSLQIASSLQLTKSNTLDILLSRQGLVNSHHKASSTLLKLSTEIATSSMQFTEPDQNSLLQSSASQQNLIFSLKAYCLHSYLNCMAAKDNFADTNQILSWLQREIADPVAMANEALASTVLKSLAVLAKCSTTLASDLSRSLPRFIVQSGIKGGTVDVAARSLTHVLRLISQDAIVTGIYTLGNVLSSNASSDRAVRGINIPNGAVDASKPSPQQTQASMLHSTGSVISLNMSGEEETSAAYGNVVRAIVCIALNVQDEKIAALALSMLLQKLGRISMAVDLHIVREAANLASVGGVTELKSLLRLCDRISQEGIRQENNTLLEAV